MSRQSNFPTRLVLGNQFEACILVDGREVPHYGVEYNEEKKEASCWIESQAQKPFAYQYKGRDIGFDCGVDVFLDGQCAEKTFIPKDDGLDHTKTRNSIRISQTEVQLLMFDSLELTDDDKYLEGPSTNQNLGEIKIVFGEREVLSKKGRGLPSIPSQVSKSQKLHERSKKAISHQVRYGEPMRLDSKINHKYSTRRLRDLATFIFKYRPLAMLQANGIAPPNPKEPNSQEGPQPNIPPAQNKKRKISEVKRESNSDDEEEDDIDARERALYEELKKVWEEQRARKEGSIGPSKTRVKQEPKTYFAPGEVIDLT